MLRTLQQIELKLNNGKSYKYLTRFAAQDGDVAIVGNEFLQNDKPSEPMATTGQMGIATEVLDKAAIKKIMQEKWISYSQQKWIRKLFRIV